MLELDKAAPGLSRLVSADAPLDRIHHGMSFGEGPLWNRRDGTFFWVDIVGDTSFAGRPAGARKPSSVRPEKRTASLSIARGGCAWRDGLRARCGGWKPTAA